MKVYCPSCNKEVNATEMNITTSIAKCTGCNNVFNFSSQVPPSVATVERPRLAIQPKGCSITRGIDGLTIVRSWFSAQVIALTIFCLFWNGFMVAWFTIAFTKKIYIM
ncbi:MAG: hypothetical protein KKF80_06690, partial [Candidatus Omnitrophica bacterium]|nr:hypothetical protein [Candidatus Omnitrophota bacterium]